MRFNILNFFKKKRSEPEMIDTVPTTEEEKKEFENTVPWSAEMSQLETWRYHQFYKKHRDCIHGKFGAIGGGLSVECCGTGLGWIFTVKCHGCGKSADITDSTSW